MMNNSLVPRDQYSQERADEGAIDMSTELRLNPIVPSWKDEYLTGIDAIDEQHQQFFGFVVDLLRKARAGSIRDDQQEAMVELINYACDHFATEEEWMRTQAYPAADLKAHCGEPVGFIDDVAKLRARMYDGEDIFADLLIFASEWLVNHITGTDMKYVRFARERLLGQGSSSNPSTSSLLSVRPRRLR
jgi:hemerythrin